MMLKSNATLSTPNLVDHSNFLEPTLILSLQQCQGLKPINASKSIY